MRQPDPMVVRDREAGVALKVAVLGTGDMGCRHLDGWSTLGHEVVAVADADLRRAREVAERYGVERAFGDYRQALREASADVVSICLPLSEHAPATILAADNGKHVLTEKPLALNPGEAREMEAAVARAGVHFGVGFQRNLAPGVPILRDLAAEGVFGRPMLFTSDLLQEVRPKRAMHDRRGNNGPLTDAGCHYYLLWQTVFRSRPSRVYAQGRILGAGRLEIAHLPQLTVDTAAVTVEFESGDLASLTASWGLAEGFQLEGRSDRIVGPSGGAEFEVNRCITVYRGHGVERIEVESRNLWQHEIELFARAIGGGPPFPYGFAEGKQMIAVTEAIFESIDSGRPVTVGPGW
jgi:myo-inositol 2-dehydrogenase / D-chiro-inositol 1-dehydrogenase